MKGKFLVIALFLSAALVAFGFQAHVMAAERIVELHIPGCG
jgi:hypothetical protein